MNEEEIKKELKEYVPMAVKNFMKTIAENPKELTDKMKLQEKYNNLLKDKIKLQNNWNELKKWLEEEEKSPLDEYQKRVICYVYNKMQEIEEGNNE